MNITSTITKLPLHYLITIICTMPLPLATPPSYDQLDYIATTAMTIVMETRNILLQKLQSTRNAQVEKSNTPDASSKGGSKVGTAQRESVSSGEKDFTEIVNATDVIETDDEEHTEQWLEELDVDTSSLTTQKHIPPEEDVSFSDLEDDSNDLPVRQSSRRPASDTKASSPSGSSDWVQLNDSSVNRRSLEKALQSTSRDKDSEGESSDWHTVDDYD